MTLAPDHYAPVLKVKRGEKAALGLVPISLRSRITPLLEIVQREANKSLHEHLDTAFRGLRDSVHGYPRCLIDTREIHADGPTAAAAVFSRAAHAGIVFTPVTGVSRQVDVEAALAHCDHGLALRVTRPEFERGDFPSEIEWFLARHSLAAADIDLIVDLGTVSDMVAAGVGALAEGFIGAVPYHSDWRTLVVSASAFPKSMRVLDTQSYRLVERTEWLSWKENLYRRRNQLARLPNFSDCVIQHPLGVEGFDPRIMQVSASIRYATTDNWLLVKGESTRITPATVQFPNLAVRLVYGHLGQYFLGAGHCAGCNGMQQAADGASGYGSAEVWRRLGTIHHMSLVMQELAGLASP